MGPNMAPSAYSMIVTAHIVGYGYHMSACTSLEPSWCRLGAVQVMALGAKFGPPARWPMDLFHGTYPAWPMIG